MKGFIRALISFLLIVVLALLGGYFFIVHEVDTVTQGFLYQTSDSIPVNAVGMVLGAQIKNKAPSPVLASRLATAVDLYNRGSIQQLLMSGDGRSKYYDEVASMKEYALAHDVDAEDVITDPLGLRTYTSCYRAKYEFNYSKVTIITQSEHLRRAVYTCRSLGIDAIGVAAPDTSGIEWKNADYWRAFGREKGALVLAWLDVKVIHPRP